MKRELLRIFINEINSSSHEKNYEANKIMTKSIDDNWSSDLLDLNDYGPTNNSGYRFILVVIDNFSKIGGTIPLKNKCSQSITYAFSKIIKSSNRKPNLLKIDDGMEYVDESFNEFLKNNSIKRYSRYSDEGAVFAERFNRTIRDLLKKPVFLKRNADWLSELTSVVRKSNKTIHSSTKMTPIQASKKKQMEK